MAQENPTIRTLQRDVGDLKARVKTLESQRPGRKPRPLLAIKQRDVCAIDPDSKSANCPFASIYRYQNGCWGTRCRAKQHEAYERRKANRTTKVAKRVSSKAPAKKVPAKKAPARKVTKMVQPVKRTTKRVAKAS